MSIIDAIIAKVAPHNCLGCGDEGALLCAGCQKLLPVVPETCYRCHQPLPGSFTCVTCGTNSELLRVGVATAYSGLPKDLIWRLKSGSAQEAAKVMAGLMEPLIRPREHTVIVPVPTATTRVRQRGYDQAALLARELATQTRLPLFACLVRQGQAHQVGSTRQQRLRQLANAFRVAKPRLVEGAHIILIDDVVTTGATLEAAAKVLSVAGARQIEAIVFARPLS